MKFSYFLMVPLLLGIVVTAQTTNDHDEFVFVKRQIRLSKSFIPQNGGDSDEVDQRSVLMPITVPR
jgi:hypothetical protein